ncbi:MAG: hypothetical protein ACKVZ0_06290 [Gemmatimonadales bacterium]
MDFPLPIGGAVRINNKQRGTSGTCWETQPAWPSTGASPVPGDPVQYRLPLPPRTAYSPIVGGLTALSLSIGTATAQSGNGTIRYTHGPGSGPPVALEYAPPGKAARLISANQGLELQAGASACVAVSDANPLLYEYSLKADTVATEVLSGLSDFAAAVLKVVDINKSTKAVMLLDPARDTAIENALKAIARIGALRTRSDTIGLLAAVREAEEPFGLLRRFVADSTPVDPDPVRAAARTWAVASARALEADWNAARKAVDAAGVLHRCQRLDDAVLSIQFTTAKKGNFPKDLTPYRFVGEVVKNLQFRPTDTRLVVFSLGAVLGLFDNVAEHGVRDGVVTTDTVSRRPLRPMAMMLARPGQVPVWATIGIGTGTANIESPDFFFGLSIRAGGTPSKPLATLGFGAIHSSFPTILPAGATVGQPLPASIPKLAEALGNRSRWGFGITIGLQGIDFFGKS